MTMRKETVSSICEKFGNEIANKVDYKFSHKFNHTLHAYIDITGNLVEGTLLSQILYWFSNDKNDRIRARIKRNGEYWIAKRRDEWWDEIRITDRQFDCAIKKLKEKGFVILEKHKFDSMPTIYIRPDYDVINPALEKWKENLAKEILSKQIEEASKENGNYTLCNSHGNNTMCNTGNTQDVTLLTMNTYNDSILENTISPTELNSFSKEKGKNTSPMGLNSSIPKKNKKIGDNNTDKWIATKTHIEICMGRNGHSKESFETAEAIEVVRIYYEKYMEVIGQPHPRLNDKTMMFVINQYLKGFGEGNTSVQTYRDLIDFHFSTEYRENIDWTIQHFMSGEIREKLLRHNML
jgi:hypothetical protein